MNLLLDVINNSKDNGSEDMPIQTPQPQNMATDLNKTLEMIKEMDNQRASAINVGNMKGLQHTDSRETLSFTQQDKTTPNTVTNLNRNKEKLNGPLSQYNTTNIGEVNEAADIGKIVSNEALSDICMSRPESQRQQNKKGVTEPQGGEF